MSDDKQKNTGVRIPPSPSLKEPLPKHVEERSEAHLRDVERGNRFIFGRPWANDLRERRRLARKAAAKETDEDTEDR